MPIARARLGSALIVSSLLATPALVAQAQTPSDAELSAATDDLAAEALSQPGAVGLSVAIARGGEIIHAAGYGLAEVEHGVKADAETTFRIGSITKQFSAALVMKLVEQGKLSLDDSMTKYFPDYPMQGHEVTVRHLLNHTSGIKSYTGISEIMQKHISHDMTVDELLGYVKDLPFDFVPGEQFKYNNTAYYMLGAIIEQASGVSYCQFLLDEICTPLSLSRTRCDSNAAIIPNRAQGYGFENGVLVNDDLIGMDNPGPAGMMTGSARDLVAWATALAGGEVVSDASFTQMSTPTTLPDGSETGYGFGLGMGEFEGHRTISHGGGIFGFNSKLNCFPDDDLYIAVISNGRVNSGKVAENIARAALGIVSDVAEMPVDDALIQRLLGHYAFAQIEMEFDVTEKGGDIYLQATNQPAVKLLYQGDGEFRASFDTNVKIVFDISTTDGPAPALQLFQGGAVRTATRKADE